MIYCENAIVIILFNFEVSLRGIEIRKSMHYPACYHGTIDHCPKALELLTLSAFLFLCDCQLRLKYFEVHFDFSHVSSF